MSGSTRDFCITCGGNELAPTVKYKPEWKTLEVLGIALFVTLIFAGVYTVGYSQGRRDERALTKNKVIELQQELIKSKE